MITNHFFDEDMYFFGLFSSKLESPTYYFTMPTKHCNTTTRQLLKFVAEVQMFESDLRDERTAEIIDLNNLCTHCAKTIRRLRDKNISELLQPLDLQFVQRLLKELEIPDEIIVEIVIHAPKGSLNCDAFKIRQALETEKNCQSKGLNLWLSARSVKKK